MCHEPWSTSAEQAGSAHDSGVMALLRHPSEPLLPHRNPGTCRPRARASMMRGRGARPRPIRRGAARSKPGSSSPYDMSSLLCPYKRQSDCGLQHSHSCASELRVEQISRYGAERDTGLCEPGVSPVAKPSTCVPTCGYGITPPSPGSSVPSSGMTRPGPPNKTPDPTFRCDKTGSRLTQSHGACSASGPGSAIALEES